DPPMSRSGITAFDSTLQTTNIWLNDLMNRLGWTDRQRAYHALRAVLHALRDRLPLDQVPAPGAPLPPLIRGPFYEGWHPANKPLKERKKEQFLQHIQGAFGNEPSIDEEAIARAVFQVLAQHVSPGEVRHLQFALPSAIRSLWSEEMQSVWF